MTGRKWPVMRFRIGIVVMVVLVGGFAARGDESGSLYREGVEAFNSGDLVGAGRALGQLAPFTDGEVGERARYLLGRVHHLSDERPEARARYEEVVGAHARDQRPPRYVVGANFYLGRLLAEEGRFEEALGKFVFCALRADGALKDEARLWMGVCQVKTKGFAGAITTLKLLGDDPEALRWLAKAYAGAGQKQAGIEAMSKAAGEVNVYRMELADLLREAGRFAEAAKIYGEIEGETARYRQAVALQLAGRYEEAEGALVKFEKDFPESERAADAAVRHAENALLGEELNEAVRRFGAVMARYPGTTTAQMAMIGLAQVEYQRGNLEGAMKIAGEIPEAERTGDLAFASYLIGECLLRGLSREDEAEDALAAARLMEQLKEVGDRFNAFMLARSEDPRCVEAMIKYGHCQQRMGSMIANVAERRQALGMTRRMYAAVRQQFPEHELGPVLVMEMARCGAMMGARTNENELTVFTREPLANTPIGVLGLIRLGDAMRNTRRANEAAMLLGQVRAVHEGSLAKDPAKMQWAAGLRYSLGMALKESGKYSEGAAVLASVARDYPKYPQVEEVSWRIAQCKRDMAMEQVQVNRKLMGRRGEAGVAAKGAMGSALDDLRDTAKLMMEEARAKKETNAELAGQIGLDAAWCWQMVAQSEMELARVAAVEEMAQKQRVRRAAKLPATRPVGVEMAALPMQAGEKEARGAYLAVMEMAPDSAVALEARAELAELYAGRDEHELVIKLLKGVVGAVEQPEIADRLKMRLGYSYLAKRDGKNALPLFEGIGQTRRSPYTAQARLAMMRARNVIEGVDRNDVAIAPKLLTMGRRRSSGVIDSGQVALPAVLNLEGTGEFKKMEPMGRSVAGDLMEEDSGGLDARMMRRVIAEDEGMLR
jgi:TolA-binding protein